MTLPFPTLLAETHMAEVSLQYREDVAANSTSGFWYLLVPVVAIAIGVSIYKIFNRPPPVVNTPLGMLHEICRAHRIGSAGRTLLERISEEADMNHPATMFLGVTQFEAAVEKARPRIKYDRRQNSTLGMLRRRLFG